MTSAPTKSLAHAVFDIQAGKEAEARGIVEELVRRARDDEPGTLLYNAYASKDGRQIHILEQYANAEGLDAHANPTVLGLLRELLQISSVNRPSELFGGSAAFSATAKAQPWAVGLKFFEPIAVGDE